MMWARAAFLCAIFASWGIAQAQTTGEVPPGFVGPKTIPSKVSFVVSDREWRRGNERLDVTQEVPLGAKVPGFPMPHMSEPICSASASTVVVRDNLGSTTYFEHDVTFSNVGGDYIVHYLRPGDKAVPDDVQSYLETTCKQWTLERALSVPATPLPPPTFLQPPAGFSGGSFQPAVASDGMWAASWLRGRERIRIMTLRHSVAADPDPHFSADPMRYTILSRTFVAGCSRARAQIVNYKAASDPSAGPMFLPVTFAHALYVGDPGAFVATYAREVSNRFPSDVRAYFSALCARR